MQVLNKKYWPYQYRMSYYNDNSNYNSDLEFIETIVSFCRASFDLNDWRCIGLYVCFKRKEDASFFVLRFGHGN